MLSGHLTEAKYNPSLVSRRGTDSNSSFNSTTSCCASPKRPGANVTYQSWQGELPVRLYPTPAPKEFPGNFTYDDIMKFEHAVVLDTVARLPGNLL